MPSAGGVHVIIRALCRWDFQPGGGPEYCQACHDDDLPCARGEPGADEQLRPYREHALISRQEHEAWDVLLACQGQLRLAPSGHLVGIDMSTAFRLGATRGYDLLSELLPAAEAGSGRGGVWCQRVGRDALSALMALLEAETQKCLFA
jgi:hypothetical protein